MIRISVYLSSFVLLVFATQVRASSAVTMGVGRDGKPYWTYWKDPKRSEAAVQTRALEMARMAQAKNVRVVASTSRHGYGCVAMFLRTDKKLDYTFVVGAPTWDAAVNEAKRKAKNSGGRAFSVMRGWNDGIPPATKQPIKMQKL